MVQEVFSVSDTTPFAQGGFGEKEMERADTLRIAERMLLRWCDGRHPEPETLALIMGAVYRFKTLRITRFMKRDAPHFHYFVRIITERLVTAAAHGLDVAHAHFSHMIPLRHSIVSTSLVRWKIGVETKVA